jgi:hypothetical protein
MWPLDPSTILFRWQSGLSVPGGPLVPGGSLLGRLIFCSRHLSADSESARRDLEDTGAAIRSSINHRDY